MNINSFYDKEMKETLSNLGLTDFDSLWNMPKDWIEPPNKRRNGWSGVSRLETPNPNLPALFVKRQENHNTRTLIHPLNGVPTYKRELHGIETFRKRQIPTLKTVYYGERVHEGNHQAILITRALDGFEDMFSLHSRGDQHKTRIALKELANVIWDMHNKGMAHYCLYPNHVFVRFKGDQPEVRLIDLEKVRRDPLQQRMRLKDLDCYLRHSKAFSVEERQHFVDSYMAAGPVTKEQNLRKRLAHHIN